MTDSATCYGCHLNPNWGNVKPSEDDWATPKFKFPQYKFSEGLTSEEKEILLHLKEAWNKFEGLESSRKIDFLNAIHQAQQIIALRVAKRVDPEVWAPDVS